MTLVTLIDSPVANTANIARALRAAGADLRITGDPDVIAAADRLVLPGVGSFGTAMSWLSRTGNDDAIHSAVKRGSALLGICVGHQLLFEGSEESGLTPPASGLKCGLGLLSGFVRKIISTLPIPQIGWNRVNRTDRIVCPPLMRGIEDSTPFYFINSYVAMTPSAIACSTYGQTFAAIVQRDRVFGVQFHPEKSSAAGLVVLRNFVTLR